MPDNAGKQPNNPAFAPDVPRRQLILIFLSNFFSYLSDELAEDAPTADFLMRFADRACAMLSVGPSTKALANPVYNENMVESWDAMGFEIFSSWTREIAQNVADLRGGTPAKRSMAAEGIFGSKASKRALPASLVATATPSIVTPSKPWAK